MAAYSYTPRKMIEVAARVRGDLTSKLSRAGAHKADQRYLIGGLENIEELLGWIADHQKAIEKAAKTNVPWSSEK